MCYPGVVICHSYVIILGKLQCKAYFYLKKFTNTYKLGIDVSSSSFAVAIEKKSRIEIFFFK